MLVSELAKRSGISIETVRYYTRIGLLTPRRTQENGYRRYAVQDVQRLNFIQRAKLLGFSLKDIRQIFERANAGKSPCPQVRDVIKARLAETRKRLEELKHLQARMEEALSMWEAMPDKSPDGNSICHLIESVDIQ